MTERAPFAGQTQFTPPPAQKKNTWRLIFRIIRWSTYAFALITLVLVFHKVPPPIVEASPQAAARVEEKFEAVERAVASGQAATLRLDESELNSYLSTHLDLAGNATPPASAPSGGGQRVPSAPAPSPQEVEQMRSNVRDVKVQLIDDRVKAYVLFDVHGKDMTLQLEGRLSTRDGYLRFEPVSGQIGSLPIPQSSLESAVQRMMDSPENREKLKLPSDISDLRIQNGEIVATYK
jgi:hypothetical protein